MPRQLRFLALLGVAASLMGCSGLLKSNAPVTQVYVLRTTAVPTAAGSSSTASLRVARPLTAPGLESDHIVLVQSDHRMNFYSGARWPAEMPAVVESLTVDTLRASGAFADVQDSSSGFPADYLLQLEIKRFEADYNSSEGAPEVHVVFNCTLGRRANREVISSFVAEGSAAAAANRVHDVVSAFEQATNQALQQLAAHAREAAQNAQKLEKPEPSMTR